VRLVFDPAGWEDYQWWQVNDRRMLKRINLLIDDALRDPSSGRGQPERLKHRASDVWSRRINQEHRLVYRVVENDLVIFQTRFHYDD
jgi:toxin YoeB